MNCDIQPRARSTVMTRYEEPASVLTSGCQVYPPSWIDILASEGNARASRPISRGQCLAFRSSERTHSSAMWNEGEKRSMPKVSDWFYPLSWCEYFQRIQVSQRFRCEPCATVMEEGAVKELCQGLSYYCQGATRSTVLLVFEYPLSVIAALWTLKKNPYPLVLLPYMTFTQWCCRLPGYQGLDAQGWRGHLCRHQQGQ